MRTYGLVVKREAEIGSSSFEDFYRREATRVFSSVFLLCRNRAVAEDSTQVAFARAYARWDRISIVPWAGGWVTTTALNSARRGLRRRIIRSIASDPASAEEAIDLWDTVARLPNRQQAAVVLHYRIGVPIDQIAEVMECQPGTVRTHLARARATLRRALTEDSHEH
jgi:RNA polymerase sigma-70 factor (ECF subfamily)